MRFIFDLVRVIASFVIACHAIAALAYGFSFASRAWENDHSAAAAISLTAGVGIALLLFALAHIIRPR